MGSDLVVVECRLPISAGALMLPLRRSLVSAPRPEAEEREGWRIPRFQALPMLSHAEGLRLYERAGMPAPPSLVDVWA